MININNEEKDFEGVVFLDIDGVLNSEKWFRSEKCRAIREEQKITYRDYVSRAGENLLDSLEHVERFRVAHVDPAALEILNKILVENNLAIVLSSTWRAHNFTLNAFLGCNLDRIHERFLGVTGRHKYVEHKTRGLEIINWIVKNSYTGKFWIIDDDRDFDCYYNGIYLMDRLVKTQHWGEDGGLNEKHLEIFRKSK